MSSSMDETGHGTPAQGGTPALGYETQDANPNAVLGFLAVLFIVLCVTFLVCWLMFRHFSVSEVGPPSASSFADVRELPAGPELQVNARTVLLETRAKQRQELDSYAWIDRKAGTVRIPIERAMDLLLQKGLPVLPSAKEQNSARVKLKSKLTAKAAADFASRKGQNGND